jgi:hypothetical protein
MIRVRLASSQTFMVAGTALYIADSFLPWNRACSAHCLNFSLWQGTAGVEAGLAAIVLLAFETSVVLGRSPRFRMDPGRVGAVGAGLVLFFTVLKIGVDRRYLALGAWVGLALASGIAILASRKLPVTWPRSRRMPDRRADADSLDGPRHTVN